MIAKPFRHLLVLLAGALALQATTAKADVTIDITQANVQPFAPSP